MFSFSVYRTRGREGREKAEKAETKNLPAGAARRGEGIGALLYTALENRPDRSRFIGTRTWSTNAAQMHIFPKRGWKAVCVKKNDRGEGIDTVYFVHEKEERPLPLQP